MVWSSKKNIEILKFLAIVAFLYVLLKMFLIPVVTSPGFKSFTASLGFGGYFIVIGYTVASHGFAPLAGTPGVLLGVTVYGIKTGMILLYLASLVSASINFVIARRYGRKWVTKLVGEKSMKEVDEFVTIEGKGALWFGRLLGFPIFEFISYAAGLTTISFKSYMSITAIATLLMNIIAYFVFKNMDFQSEKGIMIWIGTIVGVGVVFGYFIRKYIKLKKHKILK